MLQMFALVHSAPTIVRTVMPIQSSAVQLAPVRVSIPSCMQHGSVHLEIFKIRLRWKPVRFPFEGLSSHVIPQCRDLYSSVRFWIMKCLERYFAARMSRWYSTSTWPIQRSRSMEFTLKRGAVPQSTLMKAHVSVTWPFNNSKIL